MDWQHNVTCDLGYELPLPRNEKNGVLNQFAANLNIKIAIGPTFGCVPHYTLCVEQQFLQIESTLSKTPAEFYYI